MDIINSEKYTATITIGLQKAYTQHLWSKSEVIAKLQDTQNKLIRDKEVYLSAAVSECDIILSGQIEPSLKLDFINYPKFPLEENVFKDSIIKLTKELMVKLQQNRVVIIFHNDIIMLEFNSDIDPRIVVK